MQSPASDMGRRAASSMLPWKSTWKGFSNSGKVLSSSVTFPNQYGVSSYGVSSYGVCLQAVGFQKAKASWT